METTAFLKQVEMFNGLSDGSLNMITALCHTQTFAPGEVIIARDDPSDAFYLIEDGTVEVFTAPETEATKDAVIVSLGT